jgi:membrane fusion protein (multidrug efflux system)
MSSSPIPSSGDAPVDKPPRRLSRRGTLLLIAPFATVAVVLAAVLPARLAARSTLAAETVTLNTLNVSVTHPIVGSSTQDVSLPASVQADIDTPIYARTSGYLKRWLVDIGTPVDKGQLLAEIDTPEIDASLRQTEAAALKAQADLELAQLTADRWSELAKTDAVARQDVDQKIADARAKRAIVDEARANVSRLQELESYKQVVAPYSGVITARNTEVGALIDAGGTTPGKALYRLAAADRLRVFADIPEAWSALATVGQEATIEIQSRPGQAVHGTITRRAEAIDPVARTLHVEVDVANPGRRLLPGSFGQIRFAFRVDQPGLSLPVNALLYRPEGVQVAQVVQVDGKSTIRLSSLKLGRNDGTKVDVLQGLSGGESVVLNPPDSISSGQVVRVATAAKGA